MLVLASTSTYRASLLRRLQLPFDVASPPYEEENDPGRDPVELVTEQAIGKAKSLADRFPSAVIIGGDQVIDLGGEILTKPGTPERARAQLVRLAGRTHRLLTACAVFEAPTGRLEWFTDVTEITIRPLEALEIARYVELDDPVDCAGSYKAESLGPAIFDAQRGDDPTAVIGLPLIRLAAVLRTFGLSPLQ